MKNSKNRSGRFVSTIVRRATGFTALCLTVLLLLSNLSRTVSAAAGDLDPNFGNGGRITTDFPLPHFKAVTSLESGGIVATVIVPNHGFANGERVTISGAAEAEYNGTYEIFVMDADTFIYLFEGAATTPATGTITAHRPGDIDKANAVAIQSNGKVVVAGSTRASFGVSPNFALARYNSDGQLDASFGNRFLGGRVRTNLSGEARAVAIQTDDKILVAGYGRNFLTNNDDFAIARYDANGNPDTTFGPNQNGTVPNGTVLTDFPGSIRSEAAALAIQSDGKLVAAGRVNNPANNGRSDFAVARYNADGSLDDGTASDSTPGDSFGIGGKVLDDFGNDEFATALAIQPADGRIVVAGSASRAGGGGLFNFALARYNTDGSPDGSFGFNGQGKLSTFILSTSFASGLVIQSDGKIVVAGTTSDTSAGTDAFALVRYNPDGALDASFGPGNGVVITNPTSATSAKARAIALQADGKLVVAGYFVVSGRQEFAIIRYNANGSPDTDFGPSGNGELITDFASQAAQAGALAIQPDGKIVAAGHRYFFVNGIEALNDFALARYEGGGGQTACAINPPADITVSNAPGQGGAVVNYPAPTASAACGAVTCTPASGSFFPVGTTTVNCTAAAGTSRSFNVTVTDNDAPTVTSCPASRTLTADAASCSVGMPDLTGELTATDNFTPSSGLTFTQSPAAGELVSPNEIRPFQPVTFTVTDAAGNASTCATGVRVEDRAPPTIITGANDRTLTAIGCLAFMPSLIHEVFAVDTCTVGSRLNITQSPAVGTPIAAGTTTAVTITVEDLSGNRSTSTTMVTATNDDDCDGIENSIDLNQSSAADESQICSTTFSVKTLPRPRPARPSAPSWIAPGGCGD